MHNSGYDMHFKNKAWMRGFDVDGKARRPRARRSQPI